jgi:8-oxo-dGTP pyrophosphatase MutT (NUDIX family)
MQEHRDEPNYEKRPRAGLIPWIKEDGVYRYLMMIASDPRFGGPRPMISKGKIEDNEDAEGCALREAIEELGLREDNLAGPLRLLTEERVALYSGAYQLTLYSVPIIERWNFNPWCDETEYTQWFTLDEFREQGRRDHIKFVERLEEKLRGEEREPRSGS